MGAQEAPLPSGGPTGSMDRLRIRGHLQPGDGEWEVLDCHSEGTTPVDPHVLFGKAY